MSESALMGVMISVPIITGGALFWMWVARMQDRAEPEKWAQLFTLFALGMLVTLYAGEANAEILSALFPSYSVEDALEYALGQSGALIPILMLIVAAATEEVLKFSVLLLAVVSKPSFNQIGDGIVFGIAIGLGFAVMENFHYMLNTVAAGYGSAVIFQAVVRTAGTMMLHITATGIAGYGLGKRKFLGAAARNSVWVSLLLASALHAAFNITVSTPLGILLAFPCVLGVFVYLMTLMHKPRSRLIWTPVWIKRRLS